MKIKIVLIIFFLFTIKLFSQDTLVTMDKEMMVVKVIEATPTELTYQRLDTKTKSIYTNKKQLFAYVVYDDGHKEILNENGKNITYIKPEPHYGFRKKPTHFNSANYYAHRLSFSFNLLQVYLNEIGGNIDYVYNYTHSIGINIAWVYPSVLWFENTFVIDKAGDWPGCVYYGSNIRLNYKYYFTAKRRFYFSPQLSYQNLSYNNHIFSDEDGARTLYYIERSEVAKVYGLDLLIGLHWIKPQARLNLEVYAGLSYRHKIRNYTTIDSYYFSRPSLDYFIDTKHPIGTYHQVQDYPLITIGLKIVINAFFR